MADKTPMRLKFRDVPPSAAAPPSASRSDAPSKPRPSTTGTETILVKCGHTIRFDLYAKDPFRDQRRVKEIARACPPCRQARIAAEMAAAADRRTKKDVKKKKAAEAFKPRPRLPDGSQITAVYDAAAVQWTGILTVEGVMFERRASGIKTLLRHLDDAYRASLPAPVSEPETLAEVPA